MILRQIFLPTKFGLVPCRCIFYHLTSKSCAVKNTFKEIMHLTNYVSDGYCSVLSLSSGYKLVQLCLIYHIHVTVSVLGSSDAESKKTAPSISTSYISPNQESYSYHHCMLYSFGRFWYSSVNSFLNWSISSFLLVWCLIPYFLVDCTEENIYLLHSHNFLWRATYVN